MILDCRSSVIWEMPFKQIVTNLDYLLSLVSMVKVKVYLENFESEVEKETQT